MGARDHHGRGKSEEHPDYRGFRTTRSSNGESGGRLRQPCSPRFAIRKSRDQTFACAGLRYGGAGTLAGCVAGVYGHGGLLHSDTFRSANVRPSLHPAGVGAIRFRGTQAVTRVAADSEPLRHSVSGQFPARTGRFNGIRYASRGRPLTLVSTIQTQANNEYSSCRHRRRRLLRNERGDSLASPERTCRDRSYRSSCAGPGPSVFDDLRSALTERSRRAHERVRKRTDALSTLATDAWDALDRSWHVCAA